MRVSVCLSVCLFQVEEEWSLICAWAWDLGLIHDVRRIESEIQGKENPKLDLRCEGIEGEI